MCSTERYTVRNGFSGWVLEYDSLFTKKDVLPYGFKLVDHAFYPDDINMVRKMLCEKFTVIDMTHIRKNTMSFGKKLTKVFRLKIKYKLEVL